MARLKEQSPFTNVVSIMFQIGFPKDNFTGCPCSRRFYLGSLVFLSTQKK